MCKSLTQTPTTRTRREVILDTIRLYGGEATIDDLQFQVDSKARQRTNAAMNVPAASIRRDIQTLRQKGWNIRVLRRGTYITYKLVSV